MQIDAEKIEFIPLVPERERMAQYLQNAFLNMVFDTYEQFYPKAGYDPPWIGYFALYDGQVVGVCGFKGKPQNNRVEIAYGTVPEYEGLGISGRSCRYLTALALSQNALLRVTARTLKEENASTRILRKNGYVNLGVMDDPDDGEVWEWEFRRSAFANASADK